MEAAAAPRKIIRRPARRRPVLRRNPLSGLGKPAPTIFSIPVLTRRSGAAYKVRPRRTQARRAGCEGAAARALFDIVKREGIRGRRRAEAGDRCPRNPERMTSSGRRGFVLLARAAAAAAMS